MDSEMESPLLAASRQMGRTQQIEIELQANSNVKDLFDPDQGPRSDFASCLINFEKYLPEVISTPFKGNSIQITSDNKFYVFGSMEGRVALVNRRNKEIVRDVPLGGGSLYSIALYNNDKYVLSAGKDRIIRKFLLSNFKKVQEFHGHEDELNCILVSRDEKWLYSASDDTKIIKWNIEDPDENEVLYSEEKAVLVMDLSKDGNFIASGGFGQEVYIYSFEEAGVIKKLEGPTSSIWTVKISDSEKYIACGGNDLHVRIWYFGSWEELKVIKAHEKRVSNIVFTPDENWVISSSNDFSVKIWPIFGNRREIVLDGHQGWIKSMIYCNETEELVTTSEDLKLFIWKIPPIPQEQRITHHTKECYKILYSDQRELFFVNSDDQKISAWDANTFDLEFEYEHESGLYAMCLTPDENYLISCTDEKQVIKWSLDDKNEHSRYTNEEGAVRAVLVTKNDQLITGDVAFRITIRNLYDYEIVQQLVFHNKTIWSLALNSDGSRLFSGSEDHDIRVFDLQFMKQTGILEGHTDRVKDLVVSTDDIYLFSASKDFTIKVWNIKDQECIKTFTHHTGIVHSLILSPENDYLLASSDDQVISMISLTDYKVIGTTKLNKSIKGIVNVLDGEFLACIEFSDIYFMEHPLNSKTFEVMSKTNNKFDYMRYLKELMEGNIQPHNPEFDTQLILPYKINSLHVYSYFHYTTHLKNALNNKMPLVRSVSGETPLSIGLDKDLTECVDIILSHLIKEIPTDPYCFRILEDNIVQLNGQAFMTLNDVYDNILIKNTRVKTPKFVRNEVALPIMKHSDIYDIEKSLFAAEDKFTREGKAIQFLSSAIKFDVEIGSENSLTFLESIADCPIDEIVRTKFIRSLLEKKWRKVGWIMYTQGLVYTLYLIALTLYTALDITDVNIFLYIAFVFNTLLMIYEVYEIFAGGLDYFKDLMNYIDLARGLVLIIVFIQVVGNYNWFTHIFTLLTLLSWIRGLTLFRLFATTRYMVNLLVEVLKDMLGFIVILLYSTFAFAMMYMGMVEDISDRDFSYELTMSYRVNLGDFDLDGYDWVSWIFFFLATMTNNIVMLNLLISIMGDTYDRVQEGIEIADGLELTSMIVECEQLLFWKRNVVKPTYFEICEAEEKNLAEVNWLGKIRELKTIVEKTSRKNLKNLRGIEKRQDTMDTQLDKILGMVKKEEAKEEAKEE